MNAARTLTDNAIRIGRTWYFSTGERMPVVAGADDDGPVTIPEDLTTLSPDDLDALDDQLVAEFDALADADEQDLAAMTAIAEGLQRIRAEKVAREAQREEDQRAIDALREQVHPAEPVDDAGEGEGDGGDDGGDDPGEPAPPEGGTPSGAAADPAKEPVMAGGPPPRRRASAAGTSARAPRPNVPEGRPRVTIVAAADVPGFGSGAEMDFGNVAAALHDKARGLSNKSQRVPVARFRVDFPADQRVTKGMGDEATAELLDRVTAPRTAEALVAAGGWCTPSVNSYDLLALDGQTGLLDVPGVQIERGGINVPSYIGIDSANTALWAWSEDQDSLTGLTITDLDVAAGTGTATTSVAHLLVPGDMVVINVGNPAVDGPHTVLTVPSATTFTFASAATVTNATGTASRTKGCMRIACPTWTEYRLGAWGLCIEHGNLMDRSFPELTRRYVQLVMNAHAHRMSQVNLAKIASTANADAVTMGAVLTDSFGRLMNAVELQVADFRSQHKVSQNVAMEVLLPSWTREMLRSDLAMRAGVDLLNISDAQIDASFTTRGSRPQFLEDYKPLFGSTVAGNAPATAWPAATEFITYPTGDFVEGNGGTIDLGVVRDSRLNATNDFTAAWTEDFRLLARRGPKARKVTVALQTNGVTGCC